MWNNFFKETILKPLLRRLGSIGAGALLVGGDWLCRHWSACGLVSPSGAEAVAAYLVAVALLAFDLSVSWIARAHAARKAR